MNNKDDVQLSAFDTLKLGSTLGKYFLSHDPIINNGNKALRYNTTTKQITLADTTSGGANLANGNGTTFGNNAVNLGGALNQNTFTNNGNYFLLNKTSKNNDSVYLQKYYGITADPTSPDNAFFDSNKLAYKNGNDSSMAVYGLYTDSPNDYQAFNAIAEDTRPSSKGLSSFFVKPDILQALNFGVNSNAEFNLIKDFGAAMQVFDNATSTTNKLNVNAEGITFTKNNTALIDINTTFKNVNIGFNAQSESIGGSNISIGENAYAQENSIAIGRNARAVSTNVTPITNAVAIGANASATASNVIVLGGTQGINGATISTRVGIGTTAPQANLHVNGTVRLGLASVGANRLLTSDASGNATWVAPTFLTNENDPTALKIANNLSDVTNAATARANIGAGTGNGTVTAVGIATANGISGTSSGGAAPALTLSLGAITPTSVAATGAVTGSNLSGNNSGDNAPNSLYSGLVSNATHTGDVTGATALTITNNAVTNGKLATMPANTFKANNTAGTSNATDITAVQAKAMLAISSTDVAGLGTLATQSGSFTAIPQNNITNLTSDIASKQNNIQLQNQGTNIGANGGANIINFTGAGVTATNSGGTTTVTIAGGGGVTDGDKGDVQISGGGATYTVKSVAGEIALKGVISPATYASDVTDVNYAGATIIRVNSNSMARVINSVAGGIDGRIIKLINVGNTDIVIATDDGATGVAANRFDFSGSDVILEPKETREFIYDGTLQRWVKTTYDYDLTNMRRQPIYAWDYMLAGASNANFATTAIATGSQSYINGLTYNPGVLQIASSATANSGIHSYLYNLQNAFLFKGGEVYECIFQPKVANNGNTTLRFGFLDTNNATDAVDGAYFEVAPNQFGIVAKTSNNNTRSTSPLIATLAVNTWYRAQITVNRLANNITFYLYNSNGELLGAQTLNANIPTVTGREFGAGFVSTHSGTTATTLVWLDYQAVQLAALKPLKR